jgi:hypothetical protein
MEDSAEAEGLSQSTIGFRDAALAMDRRAWEPKREMAPKADDWQASGG